MAVAIASSAASSPASALSRRPYPFDCQMPLAIRLVQIYVSHPTLCSGLSRLTTAPMQCVCFPHRLSVNSFTHQTGYCLIEGRANLFQSPFWLVVPLLDIATLNGGLESIPKPIGLIVIAGRF